MKIIISILVGLLAAWFVFHLDSLLINWIIADLPLEWYKIFKVILWILAVVWTGGIAVIAALFAGSLTAAILHK